MSSATYQYPKLRDEVAMSRRDSGGKTAFVVSDPRSHRFFRLGEPAVYIARQLDGLTPLEVVRRRAEEQFRTRLTDQTLGEFVESLNGLGLLEEADQDQARPEPRARRIRGSLLYLRWKVCDPDRFLESLHRSIRFFFTPAFVVVSAALLLLAVYVVVADHELLGRGLPRLFRTDAFVLAWFVLLGVLTCHELAHGLTCKHFGGHVHEMGLMLIFFQPALYCNVSDAWMIPEKSRRLWITFAGAYFELFLWSLAVLVWRLTEPAKVINMLALVVMITSGIKTAFNLNPLIKLDGYYLLSDALDVPNLNRRALAYVRSRIGRCFGASAPPGMVEPSPRERRIYLVYGLLAGVFMFVFLGWIIARFGAHMTEHYQATGFVLTSALAVAVFRRTLFGAVTAPVNWLGGAPARRLLKLAVAATPVAGVLLLGRMELKVSAPVTLLPVRHVDVRAEVEGIVEDVVVDEHDRVEAGQVIATLGGHDIRAKLEETRADLAAAEAHLRMLQAGARPEEVELARREVETAQVRTERRQREHETARRMHEERKLRAEAAIERSETQLEAAREDVERLKSLAARQASSAKELRDASLLVSLREKELDEARAELRLLLADDLAAFREAEVVARNELQEARGRLTLLLAGTRQELIEETQANIARLQAQRDYLEQRTRSLELVTPIAGVVTTPRLKDKVGQLLEEGDLFSSVHDLQTMRAEIEVPEREIADIHVGQKVVIKARAYPDRSFEGCVTAIAVAATGQEEDKHVADKTVLVTVELDNSSLALKPEITGHAKIYCGERRIIDVATRRFVRYLRVEFWSWW
jgi:multidrug resistance efflux pump